MSNPPTTTTTTTTTPPPQLPTQPSPSLPSLHYHHHHHPQLPSTTTPTRDYHKGNWTIQETLTLITAKKLNEDYRTTRPTTPISAGKLRWNWIEDYCWSHGCYRSQNQCNDKWDNLLRDYKKVHRYQQSRSSSSNGRGSYWKMERHDRKLNNLPSNMSREVYEALNEVVQRRYNNNNNNNPYSQHLQQQQLLADQSPTPVTIRKASPVTVAAPTTEVSEGVDSGETESTSDKRESNLKKRRGGKICSSIKRSASKLAQTLKSCDEMKEKRHQQVMELEQRRLQIEDTSNEVNRQGIAHFLTAVTDLSDAIHSIFSNYNDQT
ncbi:hypothetical protein LWI29_015761 [Acer saccharum]|uniref:Myb-like domain-containing protein n=1 Tax=Acer saccharum TaxID=4024 RepID=A0AA39RK31_ACESA|nr:hypothetical protein LWI29_015761 [Acer saccharum]